MTFIGLKRVILIVEFRAANNRYNVQISFYILYTMSMP